MLRSNSPNETVMEEVINEVEEEEELLLDEVNDRTVVDFDKETLIREISKRPCVWNSSHVDYKDIKKKRGAWNEIRRALVKEYGSKASVNELKIVWKNVREGYIRCKTKREKLLRSNVKKSRLPTCNYFTELEFLGDPSFEFLVSSPESQSSIYNPRCLEPNPLADVESSLSRKRRCPSRIASEEQPQSPISVKRLVSSDEEERHSKSEDANVLFCRSLAPLFDELSPEQNMMARIKIQQVLYNIKYEKSES